MNSLINHREEIIKLLAKKYNKSYDEVERIVMYQYKFIHDEFQSGNYNSLMLMHIGKWFVPEKKKNFWNTKLGKTDDKGIQNTI
jgi:nucleoid DNA-binding protein